MSYLRTEHRALVDTVKVVQKRLGNSGPNLAFVTFASLAGAEDFINDK
jgi:hypothetical protein